jgi:hypothetical protein
MPETTTGQEPTTGGQEPTVNNTAPAKADGQEPKVFDEAYVKQLRAEAAKYRKEAQEAAAKVSAFEQQQMSEAEKLQATTKAAQDAANAARSELQAARAQVAIAQAAATHGVNPAKLARLVTVEFDADGQPVGVEAAVAAVLNEWPELKPAAAAPTPGATNPPRAAKLTLDQIKKMTPAEINERWEEVRAVLAGG